MGRNPISPRNVPQHDGYHCHRHEPPRVDHHSLHQRPCPPDRTGHHSLHLRKACSSPAQLPTAASWPQNTSHRERLAPPLQPRARWTGKRNIAVKRIKRSCTGRNALPGPWLSPPPTLPFSLDDRMPTADHSPDSASRLPSLVSAESNSRISATGTENGL